MQKKFLISYDHDADVVYISLGRPLKAISEEVDEDVLARYSPRTGDLVGMTILNFSKRFTGKKPEEVAVPASRG